MSLTRYHAKRNFKLTTEPKGQVGGKNAKARAYLIQKHAASHLHYDFRLELNGVLLSWAVPKGPSLDPADKRLAMHVEDHPLDYGGFEGIIPKGQYGGGTVMLWDRGTWTPVGDAVEGVKKGHLKFDLHGDKLQGRWALVRTHGSKYGGKAEAWLLIKDRDDFARRGIDARIIEDKPNSVLSERNMDQITAAGDQKWHSNRTGKNNMKAAASAKQKPARRATSTKATEAPNGLANVAGARRVPIPKMFSPTLATLVKSAPSGDDWIHEIKYDGYRMVSRLDGNSVRMYSRNAKEWSDRFPSVIGEVKKLKAKSALIDGEVCAVDAKGRTDFQALQNAISEGGAAKLMYFAFDLMYLDGYDLTNVPLTGRKRLLEGLIGRSDSAIVYSPDARGSGAEIIKQVCPTGFEGIISKRADSTYATGLRTKSWVKIKCSRRQEMVIGGYTDPQRSRQGFGALLLGVYKDGELLYSGKVGTGFDDKTLVSITQKLKKLEQKAAPFVNPPRGFEAKGAHWVEPKLVAEVQFTEWSSAGALRHPSFMGLRLDKKAIDVIREHPVGVQVAEKAPKTTKRVPSSATGESKARGTDMVAGIKLSHPDKFFFPETKLTKLDLARYYESVCEWILPHVKDRPLSLLRCPDGWNKECFYQKHANPSVHSSVKRVEVPEGGGTATYFAASSLQGLVSLAQWGVVELHPWGSRMPHPEKPDRLIFDFDPADDVTWLQLVKGVEELRTLLKKLGLTGFLKTTGGKGLHVVVPIKATLTWPQAKAFTKAIVDLFAKTFPDRFVANMSKAKRTGKIFLDYLRNAEGATAIAPYGIRARKNAPVSTPIDWKELAKEVRHDHFNVRTVQSRLSKMKSDPWKDFAATKQTVTKAMLKQVGAL